MENKHKIFSWIGISAIALFSIVIAERGIDGSFLSAKFRNVSQYGLSLNSSNSFTGSTGTKVVYTNGSNPVTFSYTSCSSLSGGHVKINENGTIANDEQLTSVDSVLATYTASTTNAELQFRASYDKKTWGEWGSLASGITRSFSSEPYYFEFKAINGAVNLTSLSFEYSCSENPDAQTTEATPTHFVKVEDAMDDYSGEYLIVYEHGSSPVAFDGSLSKLDANNDVIDVEINDNKIVYSSTTHASSFDISLIDDEDDTYSVQSRSGIYIGEKSGGLVESKTNISANKIIIYDDSDADISGGNYYLRYNVSSSRFRYYASNNMKNYITLYRSNGSGSSIKIPEYEAKLQITDNNFDNYIYGHSLSESFETENFKASVLMSDGTETAINPSQLNIDIEKGGAHYASDTALNSEGTYNVTISYGELAPVKYQITVSKIAVASVTFDKSSLRLKPSEDYTLAATVLPETAFDKSLTWTSTNNSVATVSTSGKVTAVADGTAAIKATANNGVSATCNVTVSNQTAHSGTSANDPFTVSEAIAYYNEGGKVTTGAIYITGVVTSSPSNPTVSSGRGRLYITDGNETLYIYNINGLTNTNNVTTNLIKVGNTLVVTGAIKDYQGTPQLAYVNGVVNCYIISSTEQVIPVTGITVSPTSTDVSVNSTVTLSATIFPSNATNKGVVWSSSNSNVASVDQNGVVTGLIVGQSATIYAKSAENNSISASCIVNVKAIAVQSVSLDQDSATIAIGDELTLTHTISPANATNTNVTWSSNNQSVATVSNGVVSALAEGEATITVKTDDGNHTASCVVTVVDPSDLPQTTTVTIDCTKLTSPSYSANGITLTSSKAGGTSDPAISSNNELRIYANNTMTISGTNITKIEITANTCGESKATGSFVGVSTGSYSNWTWTGGPTESVKFTASGSGQIHITQIVITCGSATPTPEPTLESIKVTTNSHRTYTVGDTFAKETVKAVYSDESEVDVTNEATFSGYNMNTTGTQTVSVSYCGKLTSYQITVNAKVVTLTSITVSENYRTFNVGDTFVGETVTAHYSDGSSKTVTATFSGYDMSTAGTCTINVSYTEGGVTKNASYTITVKSSGTGGGGGEITPDSYAITFKNTGSSELTTGTFASYIDTGSNYIDSIDEVSKVYQDATGLKLGSGSYKGGFTFTTSSLIQGVECTSISIGMAKYGSDTGSVQLFINDSGSANASFNPSSASPQTYTFANPTKVTSIGIYTTAKRAYITGITIYAKASTPVNPTGISISGENELTPGSSTQLSLSFSPSNCNVKDVTWSSNNTSITVDQTGKVTVSSTAIVGATATIAATSKEVGTVKGTFTITVVDKPVVQKDAWTMLIYMCGADLESDYASNNDGCATDDLKEIYSLRNSLPDDVNIVVQAGGAKAWSSEYSSVISKDKRNRFHLTKSGYVKDSQVTKVNMGDEASLEDFVEWGLETYPAEKVGLVFWDHGSAMGGCCFDEQYSSDGLTPAEVASAVPTAISKSGYNQNLEFIGYDCCLMSIQDIAGLNADYANYMVASQESEWGYGWSYDTFVDKIMSNKPTTTILQACVDGFAADTAASYANWGDPNDQTLAYYNLQNWSAYETAWENFAGYLTSNVIKSSSNWSTFTKVVNQAQKYGYDSNTKYSQYNGGYCYDIFDVKDFLNKLKKSNDYKNNSTLMSYVSAIESAYAGLGIYSKCGSAAGNSNGLCFFCPLSGYNEVDGEYASSNTKFSKWRDLCVEYGKWY